MTITRLFINRVLSIFLRVGRLGVNSEDSEEVRVHKAIQMSTIIFGAIPIQAALGTLAVAFKEYNMALVTYTAAALSLAGLAFFVRTGKNYNFFTFSQLALTVLSSFLSTLLAGGPFYLGFSLIWGLVVPMLALVLYNLRQAIGWFMTFLATVGISALAQPYLHPNNNFPPTVIVLLAFFNLIGISTLVFAALAYFVTQRALAFRLLSVEREKSENLLLNILPKEIAEILKNNNRVIADHFDEASILFADVVNFTPMSATMTAVELVELLNEVFSYFDNLVERYGLEKIKTIGDCYMAASGVPRPNVDHALTLTRMALEMQAYVNQHPFQGQNLKFRIGINSGPVVAGVIGRKKFIYDLWGDTVNTASRMELHGKGNSIQITKDTYELIKDEFVCEPQGVIYIKGKGEMEVWYVVGARV